MVNGVKRCFILVIMLNFSVIRVKNLLVIFFALFVQFLGAQEVNLRFESDIWDFGQIAEDGGKVEYLFKFGNNSDKPIVILDIKSGCGCTTPEYSRKPIKPGESGNVKITFDPMNRPGRFTKSVSITTSASSAPLRLTIQGEVLPRQKSIEEEYPFDLGNGLRLSANFHAFSFVGRGEKVEERVKWINTSESRLNLRFVPREQSGLFRIEYSRELPADAKGEFILIYNIANDSDKYGTLNDIFDIEVNGTIIRTMLSAQAIAVDKYDADNDDISVPVARFSKNFIKFAEVKHSTTVVNQELEISNEGESDLIIRAVEFNNKALRCSLKEGDRIRAGGKKSVQLTLNTSDCDFGVWVDRLRIVTNDPVHPMRTLRVTAVVVE